MDINRLEDCVDEKSIMVYTSYSCILKRRLNNQGLSIYSIGLLGPESRRGQRKLEGTMAKKTYQKPVLKSRKIELGVFGSYNDGKKINGDNTTPIPVDVIRRLNLHME